MDYVIAGLAVLNLVMLVVLAGVVWKTRGGRGDEGAARLEERLDAVRKEMTEAVRHSGMDVQERMGRAVDGLKESVNQDLASGRKETGEALQGMRASMTADLANGRKEMGETLSRATKALEDRFGALQKSNEDRMRALQDDNAKRLDQMRATVDERLQKTLETRLGESFRMVSERLEVVHKGLGEMQALASGVGDLKKVLTNVKARGTWGEIQLGNLLEQVLTADQYATNVATRPGSAERVEFAIKLPGRDGDDGQVVWLPIDAKFPKEDYERLVEAQDRGDLASVEAATKQLEVRIKNSARDIHDKYLSPPETTDFGIMFLPTEGLFAEVLRRPGLCEQLQREWRVVVAGPTTLAALLNSLQMGFRTLAIEKRSSEVWKVLGAVKTEFGKFGDILARVHKQLQTASNTIDGAARKTRTIERRLRSVESLPAGDAERMLGMDGQEEIESAEDEGEDDAT